MGLASQLLQGERPDRAQTNPGYEFMDRRR